MKKDNDVSKVVNENFELLLEEIKQGKSERLQKYFEFCARFYNYSVNNQMWVQYQMPTASRIASFKEWNELGYLVKKGEKSLKVLAPSKYKYAEIKGRRVLLKDMTEEQKAKYEIKEGLTFVPVPVFDISQVEKVRDNGYVDSFFTPLEGDNEENYNFLKALIIEDGIEVIEKEIVIRAGVQGASFGGRIEMKYDAFTNMVLTIIHEWAHELLHKGSENKKYTKGYKEAQAEATAYIVGKYLGLDNPFASDYIQHYGNNVEDMKKNFKEIMKASSYIIERILEGRMQLDIAS